MLNNAESDYIEADTENSRQGLCKLAAACVAAREEERQHIAREVHDELGQILAVLRMNISLLRIQSAENNPQLLEKIQDVTELTDRAIRGVRNVTMNLRPPFLDEGIVSAIRWLSGKFTRHTAIPCILEADIEHVHLDDLRSVAIFRIVQESLANIAQHAEAASARISLMHQGNSLLVEVHDKGKGFDPHAHAKNNSFGIVGMRERAVALGADFDIVSTHEQGTTISVRIPIISDTRTTAV